VQDDQRVNIVPGPRTPRPYMGEMMAAGQHVMAKQEKWKVYEREDRQLTGRVRKAITVEGNRSAGRTKAGNEARPGLYKLFSREASSIFCLATRATEQPLAPELCMSLC
jgi:hypothetical protein